VLLRLSITLLRLQVWYLFPVLFLFLVRVTDHDLRMKLRDLVLCLVEPLLSDRGDVTILSK